MKAKNVLYVLCATFAMIAAQPATAKDGLHLNFEPHLAVPVDEQRTQYDQFAGWDLGFRLGLQQGIIQPQLSFSYLRFWNDPSDPTYGTEKGFDVPSVGAGLRLVPFETDLVNLWLDGNGQAYLAEPPASQGLYNKQQNPRGQANAGLGLGFNLTDNVVFGPAVRYDHVFYPKVKDMMVLSAGISFSIRFGGDKEPARFAEAEKPAEENASISAPVESESAPDFADDDSYMAEEDLGEGENICEAVGITRNADFNNAQKIYFDFDAFALREDGQSALDRVVPCFKQYLVEHPDTVLVLEGHTCQIGSEAYNQVLGMHRAKRIHDALLTAGVAAEQINFVSYGEEKPEVSAPETNRKALAKNRRVQYSTLKKDASQPVATGVPAGSLSSRMTTTKASTVQ